MDRVTYRLPPKHIEMAEALVEAGEFPNKSEVFRTAVREWMNDRGADLTEPPYFKRID